MLGDRRAVWETGIVKLSRTVALCIVCGCSESPPTPPGSVEPCNVAASGVAGDVEVGRSRPYASITDGEDFPLELGPQGLYMFVVTTRVRDIAVSDEERGAVDMFATHPDGAVMSLDGGCRNRTFVAADDGSWEQASPYHVALRPEFNSMLDGLDVTIHVTIRDREGREASAERTVIARMPR